MQASPRHVVRSSGGCEIIRAVFASPLPRTLLPRETLCFFPIHPSDHSLSRSPVSLPVVRFRLPSIFRRAPIAVAGASTAPSFAGDESERAKLAQVATRLESTSRYLKRLGGLGFWGQLACSVAGSVILTFSLLINERFRSPAPAAFFATAGGVAAAFVSVFRSFGCIHLSNKLRRTANEPAKAPPRADVVRNLKTGVVLNLVGMGAAVVGMQTTVGLLFGKALTASAVPYYQGIPPGQIPVLASDVFLVQASATTILSHVLGFVCSLELLRSVTLPQMEVFPMMRRPAA